MINHKIYFIIKNPIIRSTMIIMIIVHSFYNKTMATLWRSVN